MSNSSLAHRATVELGPVEDAMRYQFANAWLIAGMALLVGSLIGLTLAIGNLLSLQHTPMKLLAQLREQHAARLAEAGLPPELVVQVKEGKLISESQRPQLSKDQLRSVELFEDLLRNLAAAIESAAEQSRQKSQFGIVLFVVVLLLGLLISAKGIHSKQAASPNTA